MAIKIGINGFGRIGRVVLRILAEDPEQMQNLRHQPPQGGRGLHGVPAEI